MLVEAEGLDLDPDAVARLATRTEGSAAGLYLAALWLRGRGGPEGDIERFAGDNRHLVDYLSEVVLGQLGHDTREFLLRTSVVERLCTALCEAITEKPAAGALEEIERSNLFLVPLDDTRTWYRYHQLFAQMLRSELARLHPDLVAVLHRRASAWYRDRGLISEAIEHATAAGDYADAAALISAHWLEIGRWGQEATIRRWLDAFGPGELEHYPELGLVGAFLTGVSGGSEPEFRRWLELAERGLARTDGGASVVAGTTSLRAGVSLLRSAFGYRSIRAAAGTAAQAARIESETDGVFRVVALANLAFLLYLSGEPARARRALSEAIRDPEAQRRPYGFITALTTGSLIALDEVRPTRANTRRRAHSNTRRQPAWPTTRWWDSHMWRLGERSPSRAGWRAHAHSSTVVCGSCAAASYRRGTPTRCFGRRRSRRPTVITPALSRYSKKQRACSPPSTTPAP